MNLIFGVGRKLTDKIYIWDDAVGFLKDLDRKGDGNRIREV